MFQFFRFIDTNHLRLAQSLGGDLKDVFVLLNWINQIKTAAGVPLATAWSCAEDRQWWRLDAMALRGYAFYH